MTDVLTPEGTGTPVTARRAQTRDRLMAAALSVFAARGIPGASVEEICEAAGFTRGAFYSNFTDKDDLVLALIQSSITSQYAAAEQAISAMKALPGEHSAAELVSFALTEFEAVGRPGPETVLAQQELLLYAARQPSLRDPYLAFVDACAEQIASLITDAMKFTALEFTCEVADAIELLTAAHSRIHLQSLFTGSIDGHLLRALLSAITLPAGDAPASA
jgi:AcrR family transcriptional regulator